MTPRGYGVVSPHMWCPRGAGGSEVRQSCTLSRGQTSYPSPTAMPDGQGTGAQIPGPGLGEGDTHLAARAPREQEETQPAAPWPWQEINKTNTRAISISTLGEGAKCQGAGGGRETQRRFTTFPLFSFTRVYTQVLPLSLSLSFYIFILLLQMLKLSCHKLFLARLQAEKPCVSFT